MRWLICTNGEERYDQAAIFAVSLIDPIEDDVVLLGIQQNGQNPELNHSLEMVEKTLEKTQVKQIIFSGDPVDLIEKVAQSEQADIVVYGSRGRRGLSRLILGSVAAYFEHHLHCSLLFVRDKPVPLQKILVSISLSPESEKPMILARKLAQITGASVTLLHVMSQLPLTDNAITDPLHMTAEEAIIQDTIEGKHLEKGLNILRASNIPTAPVLRHGLVLDEIIEELRDNDHQLLIIGAHRTPPDLPLANLLIEDMADTILMHTRCPVLIA
jgi:nucleotide-binding universal stress UspA family protein